MNSVYRVFACAMLCALCAARVSADWDPDDHHKMHYPQLPDPFGWDVNFSSFALADDWLCIGDGPVNQVHFWISWFNDQVGVITNVHLSVHRNIPPDIEIRYSRPGELLWQGDFIPRYFKVRPLTEGPQGWYDPWEMFFIPTNHFLTMQVNVHAYAKPGGVFTQRVDTIYWLDIRLDVTNGIAGWKSSVTNFMDDAVYWNPQLLIWQPLTYPPDFQRTMDLSFVIDPVPEPYAGLALLALFGLACRR